MKRATIVLLLATGILLFGAGCSELSDSGDTGDKNTGDTGSEAAGENYGEEKIGYRSGNDGTEEQSAEDGKTNGGSEDGDWGNTGDSANTGDTGDTGGYEPSPDAAPTPDDDSEIPDKDWPEQDVIPDDDADIPDIDSDIPPLTIRSEEEQIIENPYYNTAEEPATTFSIDVDTGSYTLVRGFLRNGQLPPAKNVRIEEMVNYFKYHYAQPPEGEPFSVYRELSRCPWNPSHDLLMVGIQGDEVAIEDQPPANIVYLIDVSGSMSSENKLPLLKKGFRMMTNQLRQQDRVAIVVYAGSDRVVLESTPGDEKEKIITALDNLSSGGSTNGAGGIQKAYEIAQKNFIEGGTNRVILATDGDFNVGISDQDKLVEFISEKRKTGVFLSIYGFGDAWGSGYDGNYQDEQLEQIADNGNGIYFYIDGAQEARRAFIHTLSGSLLTIAKDVKLQVEFNPEKVKGYRLIGYTNRVLDNEDFDNDTVDAGELGAGLSVTAFIELIPANSDENVPDAPDDTESFDSDFAYDTETGDSDDIPVYDPVTGDNLFALRIRYKNPDSETSDLLEQHAKREEIHRTFPSLKFLFAAGITETAMLLRHSMYLEDRSISSLVEQLKKALPADSGGAVSEFVELAETVKELIDSHQDQ